MFRVKHEGRFSGDAGRCFSRGAEEWCCLLKVFAQVRFGMYLSDGEPVYLLARWVTVASIVLTAGGLNTEAAR